MKIFFIGFMGAGKSYWAKQLSEKLNIPFFDLDEKIEEDEGKPINQVFEEKGEEYFRMKEKDTLHILTESHETFVMACGGGAPCYFNNIDYMNRAGTTVWMNTPIEILYKRLLAEKSSRPLLKSLDDRQLKGFIIKKFSDRKIFYQQADVVVDENVTLDQLVAKTFHA
jgi:shikimate kinase